MNFSLLENTLLKISDSKIIEIFCSLDDFMKEINTILEKNMKKIGVDYMDKVIFKKRAIVESVNNVLKNTCQIEYSRHKSLITL